MLQTNVSTLISNILFVEFGTLHLSRDLVLIPPPSPFPPLLLLFLFLPFSFFFLPSFPPPGGLVKMDLLSFLHHASAAAVSAWQARAPVLPIKQRFPPPAEIDSNPNTGGKKKKRSRGKEVGRKYIARLSPPSVRPTARWSTFLLKRRTAARVAVGGKLRTETGIEGEGRKRKCSFFPLSSPPFLQLSHD